jgi:hypothetical protein
MSWVDETSKIIFWAGMLEFASASQTDSGGRSVRFRMVMGAKDTKLAHPFSLTHPGARLSVSLVEEHLGAEGQTLVTLPPFECQLVTWLDSPTGRYLKIALNAAEGPQSDDLWAGFLGATRPSKTTPGTLWAAAFVLLGDDETPVAVRNESPLLTTDVKTDISTPERHSQLLSNQAAIMLKSPAFQRFIISAAFDRTNGSIVLSPDEALKMLCGIRSKRELDAEDGAPRQKFLAIRMDFTTNVI